MNKVNEEQILHLKTMIKLNEEQSLNQKYLIDQLKQVFSLKKIIKTYFNLKAIRFRKADFNQVSSGKREITRRKLSH